MRIFILSGSLRADSLNTRLARQAAALFEADGHTVDFATLRAFDSPSFDGDVESTLGAPAPVQDFKARMRAADAYVFVSPEYNFSIPGGLKNLIDWASRGADQPFANRSGLLLSASPGLVGGNRGLWALRVPLEMLGSPLFPRMFSLAQATEKLNADGQLTDEKLLAMLTTLVRDFVRWSDRP